MADFRTDHKRVLQTLTHVSKGGVGVGMLLRLVPHHLVEGLCLSEATV